MNNVEITPVKVTADATPIAQAVANIAEDDHKGLKRIVQALFGGWLSRKCRDAILQDAQNTADARAIECGKKRYDDGVLMDVLPVPNDVGILQMMALSSQIEDTKRVLLAVNETAKVLKTIPEDKIPDASPSQAFFTRWRKEVESVDDEQLRQFWANILATEVTKPGAISLRTMDVVRNISPEDANIFQRVVRGMANNAIPVDSQGHAQYANFSDMLRMEDAGLLTAHQSDIGRRNEKDDAVPVIMENVSYVLCANRKVFSFQGYVLTQAGREITRMVLHERNLNEMIEVGRYFKKMHSDVVFSLHEKVDLGDGVIHWKLPPAWKSDM